MGLEQQKTNKLIVYTTIFGGYDKLIEPTERFKSCDFICFTDQAGLESEVWDIKLVDTEGVSPNVLNRMYKMLPHKHFPEYDISLYVDANVEILKNPVDLKLKYLTKGNFAIPRHFARSCIYDEAFILLRSGRVQKRAVIRQMIAYIRQGFKCQVPMGENNILLRKHNELASLMEAWWEQFNLWSQRDQLSLAFVVWKDGFQYELMDETSRNSDWFRLHKHAKQSKRSTALKVLDFLVFSLGFLVIKKVLLRP